MPKYVTQKQLKRVVKQQKSDIKNLLLKYHIKHANPNKLDNDSVMMLASLINRNQDENKKRFEYLNGKIDAYQYHNQKQFAMINRKLDSLSAVLSLIQKLCNVIKKHMSTTPD